MCLRESVPDASSILRADVLQRKHGAAHSILQATFFSTVKGKHCYPRSVSQSAVMSAAFAKFHPNVVVGGTYSGQIVLWDNRSNKRTPVQRTPLSAAAHTVRSDSAGRYLPLS